MRPTGYGIPILTIEQAQAEDFHPITIPYILPEEKWMFERVLTDMKRARFASCIVPTPGGPEIWRKRNSVGISGGRHE
jgi:hypothetical protein